MGILGGILKEIASPITDIVSKSVVDKDKVREFEFELEKLTAEADARYDDLLKAQVEVNKTEAQHPSVFVAGWRPGIGWVGAISLFMYYPVQIATQLWNTGTVTMDTSDLWAIIAGLLGFGGLRTFDKMKGSDTKGVSRVR